MLSDTAIRNLKPRQTAHKIFDGGGLFLLVTPENGKYWRFKYRFLGKEKGLSLGVYPDVGLKEARERRDEMRKLVAAGIDPGMNRKAQKAAGANNAANTFEVIARQYVETRESWVPAHKARVLSRFEADVFPWVGKRPVADIDAPDVFEICDRIQKRGAVDTAHRACASCGQVFRYAIAKRLRTKPDPTRDLLGTLNQVKSGHFAAVTDPVKLGQLLRMLDSYRGTPAVVAALRLAPLVFVRPKELRTAEWAAINLEGPEPLWDFTTSKRPRPHIVPLSSQAVAILRELKPLTGHAQFVFPSERGEGRPMSDNALLAAMRSLGISTEVACVHGFRATARTMLDEVLHFDVPLIEHQLAHQVLDKNGLAYNRTAHLRERRVMMQAWADYLDNLKKADEP
jgi:integrase